MAITIPEPHYKDTIRGKMRGKYRLKPGAVLFWPIHRWPHNERVRAKVTADGRDYLTKAPREFVVDFSANPLEHFFCDGQADSLEKVGEDAVVSEVNDVRALQMMRSIGIEPPAAEEPLTAQDIVEMNARAALEEAKALGLPGIESLEAAMMKEVEGKQPAEEDDEDDLFDLAQQVSGLDRIERAAQVAERVALHIEELKNKNEAGKISTGWLDALAAQDQRAIEKSKSADSPDPVSAGEEAVGQVDGEGDPADAGADVRGGEGDSSSPETQTDQPLDSKGTDDAKPKEGKKK